jgi:hypothetical protein
VSELRTEAQQAAAAAAAAGRDLTGGRGSGRPDHVQWCVVVLLLAVAPRSASAPVLLQQQWGLSSRLPDWGRKAKGTSPQTLAVGSS